MRRASSGGKPPQQAKKVSIRPGSSQKAGDLAGKGKTRASTKAAESKIVEFAGAESSAGSDDEVGSSTGDVEDADDDGAGAPGARKSLFSKLGQSMSADAGDDADYGGEEGLFRPFGTDAERQLERFDGRPPRDSFLQVSSIDKDENYELTEFFGQAELDRRRRAMAMKFRVNTKMLDQWVRRIEHLSRKKRQHDVHRDPVNKEESAQTGNTGSRRPSESPVADPQVASPQSEAPAQKETSFRRRSGGAGGQVARQQNRSSRRTAKEKAEQLSPEPSTMITDSRIGQELSFRQLAEAIIDGDVDAPEQVGPAEGSAHGASSASSGQPSEEVDFDDTDRRKQLELQSPKSRAMTEQQQIEDAKLALRTSVRDEIARVTKVHATWRAPLGKMRYVSPRSPTPFSALTTTIPSPVPESRPCSCAPDLEATDGLSDKSDADPVGPRPNTAPSGAGRTATSVAGFYGGRPTYVAYQPGVTPPGVCVANPPRRSAHMHKLTEERAAYLDRSVEKQRRRISHKQQRKARLWLRREGAAYRDEHDGRTPDQEAIHQDNLQDERLKKQQEYNEYLWSFLGGPPIREHDDDNGLIEPVPRAASPKGGIRRYLGAPPANDDEPDTRPVSPAWPRPAETHTESLLVTIQHTKKKIREAAPPSRSYDLRMKKRAAAAEAAAKRRAEEEVAEQEAARVQAEKERNDQLYMKFRENPELFVDSSDAALLHHARTGNCAAMVASKEALTARHPALRVAFFAAAQAGSAEVLKYLLSNTSCKLWWTEAGTGHTALHIAAKMDRAMCCHILQESKADVNAKDYEGRTALDYLGPTVKSIWDRHGYFAAPSAPSTPRSAVEGEQWSKSSCPRRRVNSSFREGNAPSAENTDAVVAPRLRSGSGATSSGQQDKRPVVRSNTGQSFADKSLPAQPEQLGCTTRSPAQSPPRSPRSVSPHNEHGSPRAAAFCCAPVEEDAPDVPIEGRRFGSGDSANSADLDETLAGWDSWMSKLTRSRTRSALHKERTSMATQQRVFG